MSDYQRDLRLSCECGGTLVYVGKPGRVWHWLYGLPVAIPGDVEILTCDGCDDTATDPNDEERIIGAILAAGYLHAALVEHYVYGQMTLAQSEES